MKCPQCNKVLSKIHPFNSKVDMLICLNWDCSLYRQPQGLTENPKNAKMFKPLTSAQQRQRERRRLEVIKAGITVRDPQDGRHYRFKNG